MYVTQQPSGKKSQKSVKLLLKMEIDESKKACKNKT